MTETSDLAAADVDVDALLAAWFGDTRAHPERIPERLPWWFQPNDERDRMLVSRYEGVCRAARNGNLDTLATSPRGRLALILLLDQLPRNLYRGSADAFACDPQVLELCLEGHRLGQDRELSLIEK
ncbi:MAG: DUF924 family protein, partial [Pseudomonadota bacterium]